MAEQPTIEALVSYAGDLSEAAAKANAASATQHQFVNGDAQTDVLTESGPVPTLAKQARLYLESIPDAVADLSSQMTDGRIHVSEAVGRPLVADGKYFYAENVDPGISRTLWQRISAATSRHVADDPSSSAIAALNPLQYGDSVRFPRENGESKDSGENGMLYLPNSNNLFKTSANYDTPILAAAGAVFAFFSVPEHLYAGMNRKALLVSTTNATTNSGDLRIEYIPRGLSNVVDADKHRLRVTLWPYGASSALKAQASSAVLPDGFVHGLVAVRVQDGQMVVDLYNTDTPGKIAGTQVSLPAGWAGINRLASNLCIGGHDSGSFPQDGSSLFGRQNIGYWKGEMGAVGIIDGATTDSQFASIAGGAGIPVEFGAANLRAYLPMAAAGAFSGQIITNRAAFTDVLTPLGKVLPGSTLRRQALAQYLTINAMRDGMFATVMQGQRGSEIQLTGKFAGVSGYLEMRLVDSAGVVVRDWSRLGKIPASGAAWSAWVSLPLHVNALHLVVRATSAPGVIARRNLDLFCGYAVLFQAQSQVVFGTMEGGTTTGGAALLGVEPRDWGGTVLFATPGISWPYPSVLRAELCPGLVGPGFVTIANYLRERCPYPLLLVRLAVSGTSLNNLINDDVTVRQWSADKSVFSMMVGRNRAGQYPYSAQVMNWGSTDNYNDYWQQVLTPYLLGRGSMQIPKTYIDHYLYDGVDFDPQMKLVVVPFSRDTGIAGTYDADGSISAIRRKSMRDGAAQLGYLLGPEATVYSIDLGADSGTHPSTTDATYGIPLYSRSLAEAAAIGCGFATWKGPTTVNGAAVKFTDVGRTAFIVGFTGPLGGSLYTLDMVSGVTSFEVSTDGGSTWSKSGFTATIEDGMACRIVKASGSFPAGSTRVRCYPGSPGHYGIGYFPTWVSGALFKDGFPVSGGNDAYVVADAS